MPCKICGGQRTYEPCDGPHSYEEDTSYEDKAIGSLQMIEHHLLEIKSILMVFSFICVLILLFKIVLAVS